MPRLELVACFVFDSITGVLGFILLITASIYTSSLSYVKDIYPQWYLVAVLSVCVGVVTFVIAAGLIVWLIKQWPILTLIFTIILILNVIFVTTGCIVLLASHNHIRSEVASETKGIFENYKNSSGTGTAANNLARLQQSFQCCGYKSPADWENGTFTGKNIPDSCCVDMSVGCGEEASFTGTNIYVEGCADAIRQYLKPMYQAVLGMHLAVAIAAIGASIATLNIRRFMRQRYDSF